MLVIIILTIIYLAVVIGILAMLRQSGGTDTRHEQWVKQYLVEREKQEHDGYPRNK